MGVPPETLRRILSILSGGSFSSPTISNPTFSGAWGGSLTNISGTNIKDSTRAYAFAQNTSQSLSSGAGRIINFSSVVEDSRSAITTGAAWRYVVQSGHEGFYLVSSAILIRTFTGSAYFNVFKKGVNYALLDSETAAGADIALSGAALVDLTTPGDYFDLQVFYGAGGPFSTSNTAADNHVSIIRLVTDL